TAVTFGNLESSCAVDGVVSGIAGSELLGFAPGSGLWAALLPLAEFAGSRDFCGACTIWLPSCAVFSFHQTPAANALPTTMQTSNTSIQRRDATSVTGCGGIVSGCACSAVTDCEGAAAVLAADA